MGSRSLQPGFREDAPLNTAPSVPPPQSEGTSGRNGLRLDSQLARIVVTHLDRLRTDGRNSLHRSLQKPFASPFVQSIQIGDTLKNAAADAQLQRTFGSTRSDDDSAGIPRNSATDPPCFLPVGAPQDNRKMVRSDPADNIGRPDSGYDGRSSQADGVDTGVAAVSGLIAGRQARTNNKESARLPGLVASAALDN